MDRGPGVGTARGFRLGAGDVKGTKKGGKKK
jgi:hypothetical protein